VALERSADIVLAKTCPQHRLVQRRQFGDLGRLQNDVAGQINNFNDSLSTVGNPHQF
jgi:hypothetical protein